MEIGFYHLTRTNALAALPKLLGRTLSEGQRALVLCTGPVSLQDVSHALWASSSPDWLPHGSQADPTCLRPEWQPIWLSADPASPVRNGAKFLFLLGGASAAPGFERIFDLFNGNIAEEVAGARRRWSAAKVAGHRLTYWQQGDRGWTAQK